MDLSARVLDEIDGLGFAFLAGSAHVREEPPARPGDREPLFVQERLDSHETSRPTGLGVGAKVPVNFLPEAPEEARILGRINWIPPVLLLLLGPTLVVLAIRGIRIEGQRSAGGGGDFPA